MKKVGILLLTVITAMLVLSFAYAADPSGATVSNQGDNGEFQALAADTANVEAGNITTLELDTNQTTLKWVGLLGNVSGNIVLGDSGSNTLFTWAAEGNLVFASIATPTWSNLANATSDNITGVDNYLAGAEADNYSNTFVGASESIGSNIFTINAEYASTSSNGGTAWKTYGLWDTVATVYAGKVDVGNQDYLGNAHDFQMIIPEDGTAGDTSASTYNLWVELI